MAEEKAKKSGSAVDGLGQLPVFRQIGVMLGLAASVALGVMVVLWSQQPSYRMLYSGLTDQDTLAITNALESKGIPHQLTAGTGTVMVPADRVHEARLQLAGSGLPKGSATGFELLDKEQGLGVSQFMENAQYQRALEGELARTIGSISGVQTARVHLAVPKQSSFVRERDKKFPSASVMLNVMSGRQLDAGQVGAIVHLVASSVPNLSPDSITVVDQSGKLLTGAQSSSQMRLTANQFDYRRQLEEYYINRIEDILTPILGTEGVRAQVSAEVDFSVIEQTQESFNPDLPAIRSEQTSEDLSRGAGDLGGVPGALTNQPSVTGAQAANPDSATGPQSSTKRVTRNYELDKTISHTQFPTGNVRRLSIAVVVDDRQTPDAEGNLQRTPRTEDEINRITALAKEAVGFNPQRGDSLNVINASFTESPKVEPLPEPALLDQPWVWDVGKQVLAGIGVLILIFGVLKPLFRNLVEKAPAPVYAAAAAGGQLSAPEMNQQRLQSPPPPLLDNKAYEQKLGMAQGLAKEDPKRVAQVVKTWVASDG